uniref:Photosystem II 12 kDa extrinsic protein n=1 Tax=Strombidinopsis acuminata TaxID=141414 RepID=A0A7S3U8J5_9SPIT|mmetsp:Transcript_13171/g.33955  ORF Transcript_13171/g.33955 Transcript_13171/m.33955 type:complete len:189 (+) Transcript_13171:61-627(+)
MSKTLLALALLVAPAAAYVAPSTAGARTERLSGLPAAAAPEFVVEEPAQETSAFSAVLAGCGIGAALGWLSSRRQQVASVVGAAAVAASPFAASAIVDYDGIKYLGGSDKVDLNNANVQAYRQFPGMYPSAAGQIATHGPYKAVSDIYNIPNLDEKLAAIMKKYESNFVVLPANEAYFIDRINNGMYR